MRYGIQGFLAEEIVDLQKEATEHDQRPAQDAIKRSGSCRYKLQADDLPRIVDLLRKYSIRYVFLIGGNDTMDTIHRLEECARGMNYDLIGIGIPKTVDNDLYGTDHTRDFRARHAGSRSR